MAECRDVRRRVTARWWIAALLAVGVPLAVHSVARADSRGSSDVVRQFRLILKIPVRDGANSAADLARRRQLLEQSLKATWSVADLRDAILLQEWRDDDTDEQIAAVDRSARLEMARCMDRNLAELFEHGDPARQLGAITLIGEMAGKVPESGIQGWSLRGYGPGLAALTRKPEPGLAEAAAPVLGLVRPEPGLAAKALGEVLESERARRRAAVEGMVNLVDSAIQLLRRQNGLGGTAFRAEAIAVAHDILPLACGGLADPDVEVRHGCVLAVERAGALLVKLASDPRSPPSLRPADATGDWNPPPGEAAELEPLIRDFNDQSAGLNDALRDVDPRVRLLACHALEEIGMAWARSERLATGPGASSPPAEPNRTPRAILTGSGSPQLLDRLRASLPSLISGLSDRDVAVRRAAVDSLEILGDEAAPALPALARAFGDSDSFVRWAAVRTVGRMSGVEARVVVPQLIPLLVDPELSVRLAAADALGRFGSEAVPAIPDLIKVLGLGDPEVTIAVIGCLEGLGPAAASTMPNVVSLLREPDPRVRRAAAQLLGKLGPAAQAAQLPLRQSLADDDGDVRQAAADALLRIMVPPGPPTVAAWTPPTTVAAAPPLQNRPTPQLAPDASLVQTGSWQPSDSNQSRVARPAAPPITESLVCAVSLGPPMLASAGNGR